VGRAVLQDFIFPVLLLLATGCRDSRTAAPKPQSTPAVAPATSQLKPASSAPEATKVADPASLKPIEVTPPASLAIIGENPTSEFIVHGNKGQFLRVHVESNSKDERVPTVTIVAMAQGGDEALKSLLMDSCMDGALYTLPQDGAVDVSVRIEAHQEAKLGFTLLSSTDPLLDAGIRPEQISLVDKGGFELRPFDPACGEVGDSWPASVAIRSNKFWFQIAQVQGYKEIFPLDKAMGLLASKLKPGASPPDAKEFPYANSGDAATVMTARPQILKTSDWTAWRWIEGSSQCCEYPGGIAYVVEGLSTDGRFFFIMRAHIDHPDFKRFKPTNVTAEGQDLPNRMQLEKSLAAAEPASFMPNLDELDEAARSLVIHH